MELDRESRQKEDDYAKIENRIKKIEAKLARKQSSFDY
jgi:hypothetical protein